MRRVKSVGASLLLAVLLLATAVHAAEFKIATVAPEGSQWMRDIRDAAKQLKERSEGRVVIKLYGGGVMGNEKQVLRKIRIGQLHGGAFTAGGMAEKYPDIIVYGLPLLFGDLDEVGYVRERMDSTLMAGLEKAGFVSFGFAGGGFALIFANKPVTTTADMRGQKIWVPEGDRVSAAAMEALRLSPVALPVTDVLTGLQTGLLDVVAAPPVGVIALQWHTRVKYMTTTPLMYTMGLMAVDSRAFNKLSAADQEVFRAVMGGVYRRLDQQSWDDDKAARVALESSGINVVDAKPADVDIWRDAGTGVNTRLGNEGVFSPALLAELDRHLTEYRQRASGGASADGS